MLIELCKTTSMIIANGRLYNDLGMGDYTYHSPNGSSAVDYFLLQRADIIHVNDFEY